jgi:hypothetical protein
MGSFNRSLFNRAHFNRTSAHYADTTGTVYARGTTPTSDLTTTVTATVYARGTTPTANLATSITATVYLPAVMFYQMIDWVLEDIDAGVVVTPEETIQFGLEVPSGTITVTPSILPIDWTTVTDVTVYLPAVMFYQMIDWVLDDIDAAVEVSAEETVGFGMVIESNPNARLRFKLGVSPPEMT